MVFIVYTCLGRVLSPVTQSLGFLSVKRLKHFFNLDIWLHI